MDVPVASTVTVVLLVTDKPRLSVIVTETVYVPAMLNVAVDVLASLVPFGENVTAAGTEPIVVQVYVRSGSPRASEPSAVSVVLVPVTGFGVEDAGVATVGGGFAAVADASFETALSAPVFDAVTS
jgi:hypothetical protein